MLSFIVRNNLLNTVLKLNTKFSIMPPANLLHTTQAYHKKKSKKGGCEPKKVAVVLCGCGALDGTEIVEAVSATIHLCKKGYQPRFFAPDINICAPVNHLTQDVDTCCERNAQVEAARIARSNIKQLCDCKACDYEGIVIPGGFGVARTLSDFAAKGCNCVVLPDLVRLLEDFQCGSKPIGAICIAAAIVPKVLQGAKVTLGQCAPKERFIYASAIEKVQQMGGCVEFQDVTGVTHCKRYNIFSTPAYMDSYATFANVDKGIGKMISMMCKLMK